MRVEELVAVGMSPDAARAEAMRQFGDLDDARRYITAVDRQTEAAVRRSEYMSDLRQDIIYAARKLRSTPAFSLTAILTLALGIGANTAIFSVVNGVLLKPLPFPEAERVMRVRFYYDGQLDAGSPPELADFRTRSRTIANFAMYDGRAANLVRDGVDPKQLIDVRVSANWFDILRVAPALGRSFVAGDDLEGAAKVVLLSDLLWRREFNADPAIVGRPIRLDGEQVVVIGVMPPGRGYPTTADVWTPLIFPAAQLSDRYRGARWLQMIGRLGSGATLDQAQRELGQIATSMATRFPDEYRNFSVVPVPLQEHIVGDLKTPLLVIMGAVAFVLLIACANVANLFLVRATSRESEMAIRTALGAARSRLIRQLVTESVLLSVVGAALGLVLARWAMAGLLRLAPTSLPRVSTASIDATALIVTAGIALVTGVAFGLLPALQAGVGDLAAALRAGGARGTRTRHGSHRAKSGIVVAEVALAVTLLIGAGLLLRSFQRLLAVDPGFRPEGVLTLRVSLPDRSYPSDTAIRNFADALDGRLHAIPGVRSAALSNALPLDGSDMTLTFTVGGRAPVPSNQQPAAQIITVTPEFFSSMGIPLVRGRVLTRDDRPGAPPAVVVSRALVRRHFPNEDPLGKKLDLGWVVDGVRRGGTIVGVVGDVKQSGLGDESPPTIYLPLAQAPMSSLRVTLRTSVAPTSVASAARAAVRATDRELPIFAVQPMERYLSGAVGPQRFYATLVGLFAVVALALAAVGLYGVVAYAVSQRTHELGVRVALGATGRRIAGMVVGQGLALTLAGLAVGIGAALLVSRVLRTLLFSVSAADPLTFAAVAILLVAVAAIASYIPARRAARVDPLVAMRD